MQNSTLGGATAASKEYEVSPLDGKIMIGCFYDQGLFFSLCPCCVESRPITKCSESCWERLWRQSRLLREINSPGPWESSEWSYGESKPFRPSLRSDFISTATALNPCYAGVQNSTPPPTHTHRFSWYLQNDSRYRREIFETLFFINLAYSYKIRKLLTE